jgi:hypothetical protein
MQGNQVPTHSHEGKSLILIGICLAMTAIAITPSFAKRERDGVDQNVVQESKKVTLFVNDRRPIAKAITMLEARYGWIITYEDPPYVYPADIADVTDNVRRDLDKYPKGAAPRVLVPQGGELSFDYDVTSQTGLPTDPVTVLQQLLMASTHYGQFRLEQDRGIIHVIPTASKGASGKLAGTKSVLDTLITLPAKERTGIQTLEAVCAAISHATGVRVIVGTVPLNLFMQHKDQQGVAGQQARQVLVQLFEMMGNERKLSWQLFYGPGTKRYVLNIHMV